MKERTHFQDLWDNNKKSNIYVIVVPGGDKKKTYWKNSWKKQLMETSQI